MIIKDVLLASAMLAAGIGPAAQADGVRDVMIVERGGPHVWIALDQSPDGLVTQVDPGRMIMQLDGFTAPQARRIVPVNGAPLSLVRLEPFEGGARLIVEGDFATAEAELRQGGLWIALDGAAPPGGASMTASPATADTGPRSQDAAVAAPATPQGGPEPSSVAATGPAGASGEPVRPNQAAQPRPPASATAASDVPPRGEATGGLAQRVEAAGMASPPGQETADAGPAGGPPEAGIAADPDQPGPCDATAAAVQQSPWDLDALTRHADCLVGIGARDNAAGLYERVLAFDPTHFRAAIGLARIREAQGRSQEAARLYERAASAAMTDGEALAARAAADRNRDDEDER